MICVRQDKNWGCYLRKYWLMVLVILIAVVIGVLHYNQSLFYIINHWHYLAPDGVLILINFISNAKNFVLPAFLILVTWLWRREQLWRVTSLIVVYYISFFVIKKLIGEARPFMVLPEGSFHWLIHGESPRGAEYMSFPSGHMGVTAVVLFSLMRLFFYNNKIWQSVLLLFIVLVGLSRICSGWHWPLDVIYSGLIGYLLVKLFFYGCNNNCRS